MKQNKIWVFALALVLLTTGVFATSSSVNGGMSLTWTNAYNRPQLFAGTTTGDLAGTITLTTNTDYDLGSTNVGTTWSDNVVLVLSDSTCLGFYAGSNVNAGRNAGTFTLSCDNGNIIQGMMYGVNDAVGNMNLVYTGFLITPTPGPKGDKGDTGNQGEQGLPGINGIDGTNGINGVNGKDGTNGIDGQDGAVGPQGIQGIQGEKGDKGDTGATGPQGLAGSDATVDLTPITNRLLALESFKNSVLTFFTDFSLWFNSDDKCINGQFQCSGNNLQKCVNYQWTQKKVCELGCNNNACNLPPKENCLNKSKEYYCENSYSKIKTYYGCNSKQGTSTSCNHGQCAYSVLSKYCMGKGCNSTTGLCNP